MKKSDRLVEYPYRPRFFNIGSHRMAYLDEGEGETIVCLHGNPTWSYMYRNVVAAGKKQYRFIVPDHIGCGFSDKPQDYSYRLADHIGNVEALLDHLQIRRCLLVVHDWGGAIGMGWAGKFPERVTGLVVCNTAAFRSQRIPLRIAVCRWPLLGAFLVRGFNGFARAALHMAVVNKMDSAVAASFVAPYDSWKNRVAVQRFVEDIPLDAQHPSYQTLLAVEEGLQHVQDIPMLLCWGGADFCFTVHFYREWQRRFPHAKCHFFPEAGHYLLEDAGEKIYPLVMDFAGSCFST